MFSLFKKYFYFVVAAYFGFWARIVLWRWHPRIIVITGSSGKTSLFNLVEAQLGDTALYSHHANSAIGLPFYILGMPTNISSRFEWFARLAAAPFRAFRKVPQKTLFIAEVDCDRPGEGKFLSKLLKPEVTLWVSVFRTHSMNFDKVVRKGVFKTHEEAIAYEYGHLAARTTKLVIANGDQPALTTQLKRVKPEVTVKRVSDKKLTKHELLKTETVYTIAKQKIHLKGLHPRELGNSLQMVNELLVYLDQPFDPLYQKLVLLPGRSTVLAGKKDITIIDSTYNTGLGAMTVILKLFEQYPAKEKWMILGDILEQGSLEAEEHEGLAHVIAATPVKQVVLLGPRSKTHTLPLLKNLNPKLSVISFENPKDVLDYLNDNLKGGETLLFKGARFLEGVIEQLLANPADEKYLVRREKLWTKRRQQWGLPR